MNSAASLCGMQPRLQVWADATVPGAGAGLSPRHGRATLGRRTRGANAPGAAVGELQVADELGLRLYDSLGGYRPGSAS